MTQQSVEHYDVVVVGAGLVGATFAALLSARQPTDEGVTPLRIALVDPGSEPQLPDMSVTPPVFDPRVVALTHASRSMFAELGVWERIESQRACHYDHMHVWDNDGTANIEFAAADIQQTSLGSIVENSILLCTVLDYLQQQTAVTMLRGKGVEAVNRRAGVALLECSDDSVLSAPLIVAADGAQSKMRELNQMAVREWDYQHKAIVATVESARSHKFTAWQNFLPTGPLAFLPLDDPSERYCSIVWSAETEKADALMAMNDDEFCQALGRAFEHRLGEVVSISRRFSFPLKQRHAVDYMHDNVVLIGDAAHTIHPLAGQGVNLGLLDVSALVKEIIRAQNRGLSLNEPSILRRYQRQRKSHNLEVMLLMEGLKRLFGSRQLWVRWLRNTGMKTVNGWSLIKNWLAKQAVQ